MFLTYYKGLRYKSVISYSTNNVHMQIKLINSKMITESFELVGRCSNERTSVPKVAT